MLVQIEAKPEGPLEILRELPDARLSILEGLNGIGKTLAVRVLELCTGHLPYPVDSAAWRSLSQGLGTIRVRVSGLRRADGTPKRDEIVWEADSADWLNYEMAGSGGELFRRILINGAEASLDDVRELFLVHRIAGDEGLVETFARNAYADASLVRRWANRHADLETGPIARLESAVGDAKEALGEWTTDRYLELTGSLKACETDVIQHGKAAERFRQRHNRLKGVRQLVTQIERFRTIAPDIQRRAAKIDDEIEALRQVRDGLVKQIASLAGELSAAKPAMKELQNARRTLGRNRKKLSHALERAAGEASSLGVELSRASIEQVAEVAAESVRQLRDQQTALHAAPAMRDLLGNLSADLEAAEDRGLSDQVAVEDPETEIELTVAQTRIGMLTRRSSLEHQPPPPQAQEVAQLLDQAEHNLAAAESLLSTLDDVERFQRLVNTNEERVANALRDLVPAAEARLQELEADRRSTDETLDKLAAERATLREQLGQLSAGASLKSLERQLNEELRSLDVELSDLGSEVATAEGEASQAHLRFVESEKMVSELRREVARAEADIRRAVRSWSSHPQFAWLAVPGPPVGEGETAAQQLRSLDAARAVAARTEERLGAHRVQLQAIPRALEGVGRTLRNEDPQVREYLDEARMWLGKRFSAWLNLNRIREELLPGAMEVEVDLKDRAVRWVEGDSRRSRPLEAFSSGEQAFAYTRARLADLDQQEPRPPNRLIVLDEFGAFIAHDRLTRLLSYLQDRAKDHKGDQVLVILPLTRDYDQLAATAVEREADELRKQAKSVQKRRYAVRELLTWQ